MIRSIFAVIGGFLVMMVAVMALFAVWFRGPTTEPTRGFMLLSLVYGFLCAIGGGYVTGLMAKSSQMNHALALAGLTAVMAIISIITSNGQEPRWLQVTNLLTGVVGVCLGGSIRARQLAQARDAI